MKTKLMLALTGLLLVAMPVSLSAQIQYFRAPDKAGLNVFETGKNNVVDYSGKKVRVGGHFAQQYQSLEHSNTATPVLDGSNRNLNELYHLSSGFNLATANLNVDAQLADGVRLNLVTYLSARHHSEAWVKGGYIQIDKTPFLPALESLMENVTIKIGHMEVNYGDAHFRRSDNGNAFYNPFVGNNIVDAFNTEIGGEIYYFKNNFMGMVGVTNGEIGGNIYEYSLSTNDDSATKSPAFLAKLAYDKQMEDKNIRFRVSGSVYSTSSSAANHILDGDRGGSRYYLVMSPEYDPALGGRPGAGDRGNFTSGRYSPGYSDKVMLFMGNVFVKYGGLELFGTYETGSGRRQTETAERSFNQIAVDALYRIGADEDFYIGGRYNVMNSEDASAGDISQDRMNVVAGWFVTDNLLLKGEYVNQNFNDYAATHLYNGGNFKGVIIEAVVGF